MPDLSVKANLVDLHQQRIYPALITIRQNRIASIKETDETGIEGYALPGFVDSHVHIESSMLTPAQFARLAVVHGTVATISDPHEIANVCGMAGIDFMIENGNTVPFKFNFGAPSCVPATGFETAGAELNAEDVTRLLERDEIRYLSEMMNFPGVLQQDPEVMKKIEAAHRLGKPVDGHAPGLRGEDARKYIAAGISTDHECFTAEEALDKLGYGMKILIREGSAAKNFEALVPLLNEHYEQMMFCSDDKHPDSLVLGHINQLCTRAVAKGIDVMKVLRAACINPVLHYNMPVGVLREGDPADFILVKDLVSFEVKATYIDGACVARDGVSLIELPAKATPEKPVNNFRCSPKKAEDFAISSTHHDAPLVSHHDPLAIPVIEALDGQLITNKLFLKGKIENGFFVSDAENDILKIVVVNRYRDAEPARAFIKNVGLKRGAIASSVAHDSHNIVAVGADDESIAKAVNSVIAQQGGISLYAPAADGQAETSLVVPLPVAGLMSVSDGYQVAREYAAIDKAAKELGSSLGSPFMTISFMALLVIPHLKLSDKGLFDGDSFSFA